MTATANAVTDSLAWLRTVAPSVFAQQRDLQLDSRTLQHGDVFIAVPGESGWEFCAV